MNDQTVMKPYVIGLDLGGTNSVFGIVDARGDIKATTAIIDELKQQVKEKGIKNGLEAREILKQIMIRDIRMHLMT